MSSSDERLRRIQRRHSERVQSPNRRYSRPIIDVDRSGMIKLSTLQSLIFEWKSAKELGKNPLFLSNPYRSGWRCLSIRLLRYTREGLLQRRRVGRCYEYKISLKGEDRLCYLWDKFGSLSPPPDWRSNGRLGEIQYELAQARRKLEVRMLKDSIDRIRSEKRARIL